MQIKRIQNAVIIDFVLQFAAYLTSKGRKISTIKRYAYDLEDCFHHLEKGKEHITTNIWSTLPTNDYKNYFFLLKNERHYSDKTIHRISVALNQFYLFLHEVDPTIENPLVGITMTIRPDRSLTDDDFISQQEEKRLLHILQSFEGFTEKQLAARKLLQLRNMSIVYLMRYYGLTLKEVVSLQMKHIHLENNTIDILPASDIRRTIHLTEEDKKRIYDYIHTIPEPVRPAYHSTDPLFVSFDFNRGTYKWVYDSNSPKALTEISVQKMIRQEVQRANLRKGICAQHFRNTYILQLIQKGYSESEVATKAGFKTKISLRRFYDYMKKTQKSK